MNPVTRWVACLLTVSALVACGSDPAATSDSELDSASDTRTDTASDTVTGTDAGTDTDTGPDVPPADAECSPLRVQPAGLALTTSHDLTFILSCTVPLTELVGSGSDLSGALFREYEPALAAEGFEVVGDCDAVDDRFVCGVAVPGVAPPGGDDALPGPETLTLTLDGVAGPELSATVYWQADASEAVAAAAVEGWTSMPTELTQGTLLGSRIIRVAEEVDLVALPAETPPEELLPTVRQLFVGAVRTGDAVVVATQWLDTGDAVVVATLSLSVGAIDWSVFEVGLEAGGLRVMWLGRDVNSGVLAGVNVLFDPWTGEPSLATTVEASAANKTTSGGSIRPFVHTVAGATELLTIESGEAGVTARSWFTGESGDGLQTIEIAELVATASEGGFVEVRGGSVDSELMVWARSPDGWNGILGEGDIFAYLEAKTGDVEFSASLDGFGVDESLIVDTVQGFMGDTVATVVRGSNHASGTALVIRKGADNTFEHVTVLPLPHHLDFSPATVGEAEAGSSATFEMRESTLTAFGRWPWNWRDKLKTGVAPHTFAVTWDLETQELVSVQPVVVKAPETADDEEASGPSFGTPLAMTASGGAFVPLDQPLGFLQEGDLPCEQAGSCRTAAAPPAGSSGIPSLVWTGGTAGPRIGVAHADGSVAAATDVSFDILARPIIVPTPTEPGAPPAALVIAQVRSREEPTATHAVWALSDADGLSVPGLFTLSGLPEGFEATFGSVALSGDKMFTVARAAATVAGGGGGKGRGGWIDLDGIAFRVGQAGTGDVPMGAVSEPFDVCFGDVAVATVDTLLEPWGALPPGEGVTDLPMLEDQTLVAEDVLFYGQFGAGCGSGGIQFNKAEPGFEEGAATLALHENPVFIGQADAQQNLLHAKTASSSSPKSSVVGYDAATSTVFGLTLAAAPDGTPTGLRRRVLATLPDPGTERPPILHVADYTGDGLDDVYVDHATSGGGVLVVSTGSGAGQAVVTTHPLNPPPTGTPSGPNPSVTSGLTNALLQLPGGTSSGIAPRQIPVTGAFIDVACGGTHTCALRAYGEIECFGLDGSGQASPPTGPFTQVVAGENHSCGLRADQTAVCWGDDVQGQSSALPGTFTQLVAGSSHSCGLGLNGEITCWGGGVTNPLYVPVGPFTSISTHSNMMCALRPNKTVHCWPVAPVAAVTPNLPTTPFDEISAGWQASCGRASGTNTIECWTASGMPLPPEMATPPTGAIAQLDMGTAHGCALRPNGSIECWGFDNYAQATAPPGNDFVFTDSGRFHSCAIDTSGALTCWGANLAGETSPPNGYLDVSVSGTGVFALMSDRSIRGWRWGILTPTLMVYPGPFAHMDKNARQPIGLGVDGTATVLATGTQLSGSFLSVAYDIFGAAGVRPDGTVTTWPAGGFPYLAPPAGEFKRVEALGAGQRFIGIRSDGALQQWHNRVVPPVQPPSGPFVDLQTDLYGYACAVRADGTATCWSDGSQPSWLAVPAGSYQEVRPTAYGACALDTSGTPLCWEDPTYGWNFSFAFPLDASFREFSVAHSIFCGINLAGGVACFGSAQGPMPSNFYAPGF
ncbi:MAG: hypothetical protein ACI9MR_001121 [Myxococcota bacterium]|jgi:hypothetical protein